MKLKQQTEWALIAVLIAYIALTPGFRAVKDILATGWGKALALAVIVYVWKYVSAIVAVLLVVSYVRCATYPVMEGLTMPAVSCTCESGWTFDETLHMCKDDKGAVKPPVACTCPSGYAFDSVSKECKPVSQETKPVPPPEPVEVKEPAPAVSTGPVTSTAPMTTPSAAQATLAMAVPTLPTAGPTPTEKFVGYSAW